MNHRPPLTFLYEYLSIRLSYGFSFKKLDLVIIWYQWGNIDSKIILLKYIEP